MEHHRQRPRVDLGYAVGSVIVGDFADRISPARRDTNHVGVELALRPVGAAMSLHHEYELLLVVLDGAVTIGEAVIEAGHLAHLGLEGDELELNRRCAYLSRGVLGAREAAGRRKSTFEDLRIAG